MDTEPISTSFAKHPTLLSTPWFMAAVLLIYIVAVLFVGPMLMKHRKPYDLKALIVAHNVIQVLSCVYVAYEILQITEFKIFFFWRCKIVDELRERVIRHFNLSYFLFWLKMSELLETIIFVMRKKQNQVSKLHVFHHIVTITLVYLLINYNQNSFSSLYPIFLNTNVHIIMYSYYLIAAVADKRIVKALMPVKKSITVIQMVQFFLIILQIIFVWYNCGVPKVVLTYFSIVIFIMLYGFYDFYKSSYKNKAHGKNLTSKVKH